jgi:hypothetical protein
MQKWNEPDESKSLNITPLVGKFSTMFNAVWQETERNLPIGFSQRCCGFDNNVDNCSRLSSNSSGLKTVNVINMLKINIKNKMYWLA